MPRFLIDEREGEREFLYLLPDRQRVAAYPFLSLAARRPNPARPVSKTERHVLPPCMRVAASPTSGCYTAKQRRAYEILHQR